MGRKEDALEYHRRGRHGKIEVVSSKPLVSQGDLSLAYTPGVAEPCLAIAKDPDASWEYTARGNLVAVISNGTAVLGLGNIGPAAGKPVMEGKACLFKKFADIDVFDLEVAETDVDKLVDIIASLEPTFGGINLEDISAPACFDVEEKLRARLSIPVFHDDQHGTAIISGAGLLNAAELADKPLGAIKLVVSGAGAAAIACVDFFVSLGVDPANVTLCDSKGVLHAGREDLNRHKRRFARADDGRRTLADALVGADMFMGLSVAGLVTPAMLQTMAPRPIIFAMANPDPEIGYPEAVAARPDALVATGRSDYPNQVNNVLGFPYIFRGALDVRARSVTEPMKVAAARALAALAKEPVPESVVAAYGGKTLRLGPEYFIPKPFDPRVLWWVAPAVAEAAMASGVARVPVDVGEYRDKLMRRSSNAAFSIMRSMNKTARRDPRKIVFPEAGNLRVLRAVQQILDEEIARPVLLGRRAEIEGLCRDASLSILDHVTVIDPNEPAAAADAERYALRLTELRGRKGVTLPQAKSLMRQSNYFGVMMLERGDVDGLVGGFKRSYPDSVRPALQVLGLAPGAQVAVGMYMMVLQNSVKFFGDTVFTVEPTAEQLADIAVQMADAVAGFGITPRVAMISYSNFGSVRHPDVGRVQAALELVRARRPELEIDGEMQPEMALDEARRGETYPFSTLTRNANTLVFDRLAAGNAAYQVLECLGNADAVGPILLGVSKPVSLLQNESTVDDIVNMTAYTVMKAQVADRERAARRA
ncbi:MAG: NADP-dependent malic enzyme [Myxococcales bacterium]|nr:NADP-dependent malic enzyme [Myxococcales bacterium]MBK7191094.1 NADP-dependent malic enzyme [Myxococcales bacterium]MBP6849005.1 NADP-dependent malic enzyme [Kofleriaceae bacterium]